jgi:ABC-type protease/lipase transport system fused ATPase/permease subunit
MRNAALMAGLIGALATIGLGAKWTTEYEPNRAALANLTALTGPSPEAQTAMSRLERTRAAGCTMLVLGILSFGAALLVFRQSKVAGSVMLAAAVIPAVLAPMSLAVSFSLIPAGILALWATAKQAA